MDERVDVWILLWAGREIKFPETVHIIWIVRCVSLVEWL